MSGWASRSPHEARLWIPLDKRPPAGRAPRRVQRRRVIGWRKPVGAINVTRPGKWGNPFTLPRKPSARQLANCRGLYLIYLDLEIVAGRLYLEELCGHDLMCWCRLDAEWCHADELLARANA